MCCICKTPLDQNRLTHVFCRSSYGGAELTQWCTCDVSNSKSGRKFAVANNKGNLHKSHGPYHFTCNDGHLIEKAIQETIATGEGQTRMKLLAPMKRSTSFRKWILSGVRVK
jgi:hypothetical protein